MLFFRLTVDNFSKIFPTAPGLDQELGSVGMMLETCNKDLDTCVELSDYYLHMEKPTGKILHRGSKQLFFLVLKKTK